MMSTILTSVLNFCFASVPTCEYVDYRLLCRPVDEGAQPWAHIETGCILLFTAELAIRVLCCPARVGLRKFCTSPGNVIDLVRPIAPPPPGGDPASPSLGVDRRRLSSQAARVPPVRP